MIIKALFALMLITASCMTECMYQRFNREHPIDAEINKQEQSEREEWLEADLLNNQLRQKNSTQPSSTSTILLPMALNHFLNENPQTPNQKIQSKL